MSVQNDRLFNRPKITSRKETQHKDALAEKFYALWHLVGNTPMVEVVYAYRGQKRSIFAKCEYYNLTGSIKDRMALYLLQQAYGAGWIRPGYVITGSGGANAGISLAAIGKKLGHHVVFIMPGGLSRDRYDILRSLGAEVIVLGDEQGGITAGARLAEAMAAQDDRVIYIDPFASKLNIEAHERTTGYEIWKQLRTRQLTPDAFVAGVGTGGTVMGVGRYLKAQHNAVKIYPLEPAESPALSAGRHFGRHRIEGISHAFVPEIVNLKELNTVVRAHDGDAILMAQKMASQLGLAVGISSGANFTGAVRVQNLLGPEACVVTVFCDSNKKYLGTDLVNEEPVKPGYLAPNVEFIEYKPISRLYANIL